MDINNITPNSVSLTKEQLTDSLNKILNIFLNEDSSSGELRSASFNLFDLFSEITNIKDNSTSPLETNAIYLNCGKAIAPLNAAQCIREHLRTAKFIRGINCAIKEAQTRFPGEVIQILYAGCGPCAPFAVAMIALFPPEQVQFTLLDINSYSLDAAEKIINTFGYQNSIIEYVCCDASIFKKSEKIDYHIVISETMLNALQKEPQVAITGNLAPQIRKNGILIPQKIIVRVSLSDRSKEHVIFSEPVENHELNSKFPEGFRERINPVTLLELSLATPNITGIPLNKDGVYLKPSVPVSFKIPGEGKYSLVLNTYITVFDKHTLGEYDSSLNMPVYLKESLKNGSRKYYEFTYFIGEQPGFKYHEISGMKYLFKTFLNSTIYRTVLIKMLK